MSTVTTHLLQMIEVDRRGWYTFTFPPVPKDDEFMVILTGIDLCAEPGMSIEEFKDIFGHQNNDNSDEGVNEGGELKLILDRKEYLSVPLYYIPVNPPPNGEFHLFPSKRALSPGTRVKIMARAVDRKAHEALCIRLWTEVRKTV